MRRILGLGHASVAVGAVLTLAACGSSNSSSSKTTEKHAAQLLRVDPPHTVMEALKVVGSGSPKTPSWIHAEGGLGPVAPGLTAEAILDLSAGQYAVADVDGPGSSGPPAQMSFTVQPGTAGTLPSTPVTTSAAAPAKDKYDWQISGTLSAGKNIVTFNSKGADALHLIGAAQITGNHSKAEIIKALASNGAPPSWVNARSLYATAVIHGTSRR